MRDLTALGSRAADHHHPRRCGLPRARPQDPCRAVLLVAVGGGVLLSTLLKIGFDRPRPDLVPHGAVVYASFPSGHAMLSAVVYLTLGALLARVQPRRLLKLYLLGLAILLTVAVGISRVYLGVHWPTDVVAGWASAPLGAALLGPRSGCSGRDESSPTIPTPRPWRPQPPTIDRVRERDKRGLMPYQGGAEAAMERRCCPSSMRTRCAPICNGTR